MHATHAGFHHNVITKLDMLLENQKDQLASHIAEVFYKMLADWNLRPKTHVVVRDNAAHMSKGLLCTQHAAVHPATALIQQRRHEIGKIQQDGRLHLLQPKSKSYQQHMGLPYILVRKCICIWPPKT